MKKKSPIVMKILLNYPVLNALSYAGKCVVDNQIAKWLGENIIKKKIAKCKVTDTFPMPFLISFLMAV